MLPFCCHSGKCGTRQLACGQRKTRRYQRVLPKPSDGLEPSTPSLPSKRRGRPYPRFGCLERTEPDPSGPERPGRTRRLPPGRPHEQHAVATSERLKLLTSVSATAESVTSDARERLGRDVPAMPTASQRYGAAYCLTRLAAARRQPLERPGATRDNLRGTAPSMSEAWRAPSWALLEQAAADAAGNRGRPAARCAPARAACTVGDRRHRCDHRGRRPARRRPPRHRSLERATRHDAQEPGRARRAPGVPPRPSRPGEGGPASSLAAAGLHRPRRIGPVPGERQVGIPGQPVVALEALPGPGPASLSHRPETFPASIPAR